MEFIRLVRLEFGRDQQETVYVRRDEIRMIQEHTYTEALADGTQEQRLYTSVEMMDGHSITVAMTADEVHELVKVKPWETSHATNR